jgi:ABC-type branched-subunit amino acid transport system ATPase component
MLALGMALLARPRLLMIDELSLGLAPVVVEQLLPIVRAMRDQGTTVILVEQSVNVALTLAETAYFMEKGEIRFHGPTAELLERPDVLRSVFLEGAAKGRSLAGATPATDDADGTPAPPAPVPVAPADAGGGGPTQATALEVVDLSVRFGGIRAVDAVSLSVAPGEILGLIGPNGAGKTTLFDLVSGFVRPSDGRIRLGVVDVTHLGPDARARRGLGRSFQDARLFPAMTVEEAIAVSLERFVDVRDPFNAALRMPAHQDSEARVRARVDELIELLGIESFRSKFVRELSTGSRRVVDLACVVAHGPSVVLLDEPSSGIAQREAEALGPLLLRIRDALGASLLVIEHDMPLVTSVADRMVALDQGRVIAEGPPREVLVHPDVVTSYLGNSQEVIARSGTTT